MLALLVVLSCAVAAAGAAAGCCVCCSMSYCMGMWGGVAGGACVCGTWPVCWIDPRSCMSNPGPMAMGTKWLLLWMVVDIWPVLAS